MRIERLAHGNWWLGVLGMVGLLLVVVACTNAPVARPAPSPVLPDLDSETVRAGRQVYLTNCAVCHGPNAEGALGWRGPDAKGNLPPPPHDDSGHTWRHSDQQLKEIILNGLRDPFNKTPDLTMPPFHGQLSGQDVEAVITYFKSLWSDEHRRYQLDETTKAATASVTPSQ